MTSKADLLIEWYRVVWEQGNLDGISQFFSDAGAATGLVPDLAITSEEFRELVPVMHSVLGPLHVELVHAIEQGEWLAAILMITTSRADTGAPVKVVTHVMVRFDGNLMVEAYNILDFLSFFEQMGQVPPNAVALMLSGAELS